MKQSLCIVLLILAGIVAPVAAQDKPGEFGIGFIAGTPLGFSGKYLLSKRNAVDAALGVQGGDLDAHFDFLTHFRDVGRQPAYGKLAPYLGLGMKIKDEHDMLFGFRFVGGLSYAIHKSPLEVFAELAPVLRIEPDTGSNLDGGVGLRYYF